MSPFPKKVEYPFKHDMISHSNNKQVLTHISIWHVCKTTMNQL